MPPPGMSAITFRRRCNELALNRLRVRISVDDDREGRFPRPVFGSSAPAILFTCVRPIFRLTVSTPPTPPPVSSNCSTIFVLRSATKFRRIEAVPVAYYWAARRRILRTSDTTKHYVVARFPRTACRVRHVMVRRCTASAL